MSTQPLKCLLQERMSVIFKKHSGNSSDSRENEFSVDPYKPTANEINVLRIVGAHEHLNVKLPAQMNHDAERTKKKINAFIRIRKKWDFETKKKTFICSFMKKLCEICDLLTINEVCS